MFRTTWFIPSTLYRESTRRMRSNWLPPARTPEIPQKGRGESPSMSTKLIPPGGFYKQLAEIEDDL